MKFIRYDKYVLCICNIELSLYVFVFFLYRSIVELESYYNYMLMYFFKRYVYILLVYRVRSILVVLDFNENVNRELIMNRDGIIRYVYLYMYV